MPSAIIPIYSHRLPISFASGQGIWLWENLTRSKPAYLDALAGKGVSNLGHSHPNVLQAIQKQASQLIHTSNLYRIEQQEQLAVNLCQRFDMAQAFFANSGAETIEAALKIILRYSAAYAIKKPLFITLKGSYHGRTLGALSASSSKILLPEKIIMGSLNGLEAIQLPINNVAVFQQTFETYGARIAAVLIEPIQGDSGIQALSQNFLHTIRLLCNQYNSLLIADEIQTGLCRTGSWLACDHAKIQPDIIVLAKALANGIPIGAYLVNQKAQGLLNGYHGSTFSGNPLSCAVALTVLETLEKEQINANVIRQSRYLKEQFKKILSRYSIIKAIRSYGLMVGIELKKPCQEILHIALQHKLLFDVVAYNTIRLLPPLIINQTEIDELVKRLDRTLYQYTTPI